MKLLKDAEKTASIYFPIGKIPRFLFVSEKLFRFLFPTFLMCPLSLRHHPPPLLKAFDAEGSELYWTVTGGVKHRGFGGRLQGMEPFFGGFPGLHLPETKKKS